MGMPQKELEKMKVLGNGFANERVEEFVEKLGAIVIFTDKQEVELDKMIGQMLGMAYCKGYADCLEQIEPKRLII